MKRNLNNRFAGNRALVRYFTKAALLHCAEHAEHWGYNRQLDETAIREHLPKGNYPVAVAIPHRHGVKCEPHVRCVVSLGGNDFLHVDVPTDFFAALPLGQLTAPESD